MPALALIALLLALPQPAERIPNPVEAWAELVRQHEPGALDDAVFALAGWPTLDFEGVLNGLDPYGQRHFDREEREQMNDLLRRGALLHTDLAMLAPERARRFQGLPNWPAEQALESRDGQVLSSRAVSGHWRFARTLLSRVEPNPARDETVQTWYHAVAAYLQAHRLQAVSSMHLADAQRLLRADPSILFYSGALHETLAAPSLQESASAASRRPSIQSRRAELEAAARYFRQAVRADASHREARLRLGRVLHLLGRHHEAATELRAAVASPDDNHLEYYGQLFLGAAEEALGRGAEARGCFERAAALQPGAQAPLLALSHLARRHGDRTMAVRFIERLAALPDNPDEREDPLWVYDQAAGRQADELFARLYEPFARASEP